MGRGGAGRGGAGQREAVTGAIHNLHRQKTGWNRQSLHHKVFRIGGGGRCKESPKIPVLSLEGVGMSENVYEVINECCLPYQCKR